MAEDPSPAASEADQRDRRYWQGIAEIIAERGYGYEDILRHWPAYVLRRDIGRFLSHYELFKQVVELPGCIVELGVFTGSSFFTWATLLETFLPFDRSRRVFGFDAFAGLTDFHPEDGKEYPQLRKVAGGYKCSAEEVIRLTALHNADFIPGPLDRANLIVGDVRDTLPKFLDDNPGLKISLLHFDMDLYEPTKYALELLYPLVVKGGIVCFDEYGLIPWQGETRAVDEYFAAIGEQPTIRKHPFAMTPHGYMVK